MSGRSKSPKKKNSKSPSPSKLRDGKKYKPSSRSSSISSFGSSSGSSTSSKKLLRRDTFKVKRDDIGTGTGTNQKVRNYANDPNQVEPADRITARYKTKNNNRNNKVSVRNPSPAPGEKYQAGHIRSNKAGGKGTEEDNIMPQHGDFNEGIHGHPDWKKFEKEYVEAAEKDGAVKVKVKQWRDKFKRR